MRERISRHSGVVALVISMVALVGVNASIHSGAAFSEGTTTRNAATITEERGDV